MKERKLVHESQPFGHVENFNVHPGAGGRPQEHFNRPGATSIRLNCGVDHPDSLAAKDEGAEEMARKHGDKPFYWTGIPVKGNLS